MEKIVTMGEIMLRLSTENHDRIVQAERFGATYGGGEANVAVALASFGMKTAYVTKLPQNALGQSAANMLRRYGVETENIIYGGERMGIYFLEQGTSIRNSSVIYDRKGSAISAAHPSEFDFDAIFDGASWFHFTGITPALGEKCAELTRAFAAGASKRKVKISFDVNYRSKLWSAKEAAGIMPSLAEYADVLFCSDWDLKELLGIEGAENEKELYKRACDRYGIRYIIQAEKENISVSRLITSVRIYDGLKDKSLQSCKYDITDITDRVGGGDARAAGAIYKLARDFDSAQSAAEFAAASSAFKHTIKGDYNLAAAEEIEKLIQSHGGGAGIDR